MVPLKDDVHSYNVHLLICDVIISTLHRQYTTQVVQYTGSIAHRQYSTQGVPYTGSTVHRQYSTRTVQYTDSAVSLAIKTVTKCTCCASYLYSDRTTFTEPVEIK